MFYRTLTVGYERNEDGKLSTRRKTWSPLTEIVTTKDLNVIKADFEAKYNELNDKHNELNNKYNELQDTIGQIQDELNKFSYLPTLRMPSTVVLTHADGDLTNEYGTIVYGSYTPKNATLTFDVIVTDTSIGDGGQFYRVADSFFADGAFEITVKNAPGAAGTAHPSALKVTLDAGNMTITKTAPITIG
jgi:hypothetical protein